VAREVAQVGVVPENSGNGAAVAGAQVDLAATDRAETYGPNERAGLAVHADRARGVLVGATAVGPPAAEWVHVLALAIGRDRPRAPSRHATFQLPTFSELVLVAVREVENVRAATMETG
jgi:pyruvate/2-oxoglutarate dehydrogenase complex dihydrolipoamide dehydrogenase (E3) component